MNFEDSIYAVITPPGSSARATIRISGPEALKSARFALKFHGKLPSYGWVDATLRNMPGQYRARLLIMRAPNSYTGEDVVEIQIPGSPELLRRVLERISSTGDDGWNIRLADPGEFSRRAVLNGKMDLAQAEGVLGLIQSADRAQRRSAYSVMQGDTGARIREICDRAWDLLSELEAAIDFHQEGQTHRSPEDLCKEIEAFADHLQTTVSMIRPLAERGADAIKIVLAGQTGAGKSSLFNCLATRAESASTSQKKSGRQVHLQTRAIVSEDANTTRDAVTLFVQAGTFPEIDVECVWLDTAGETSSVDEKNDDVPLMEKFREKSRAHRQQADILLHIVDVSEIGNTPIESSPNTSVIVVGNKIDVRTASHNTVDVETSAMTGEGIGRLLEVVALEIKRRIDSLPGTGNTTGLSARMMMNVRHALELIAEGLDVIRNGGGEDVLATLLRQAIIHLEEALGVRLVPDDSAEAILDRIFSKFCIGK